MLKPYRSTAAAIPITAILLLMSNSGNAQIPVTVTTQVTDSPMTMAEFAENAARWAQQVQQMNQQINEARRQYKALTGSRGMSALLDNPALRSYLPEDMQSILEGLDGDIDKYRAMGRLLENDRWQKAAMQAAELLENSEASAATDLANSETVYERAGDRIDEYQDFVDEIDDATDPKAIADLQARIQAENVFLQNEIIRLQAMQMAQQAKRDMREVRMEEQHVNMTGPTTVDYTTAFDD